MKTIITSFLILTLSIFYLPMKIFGQVPPKTYSMQWKAVEDAIKKGLPKSALTEVEKIYKLAKEEKQDAQLIKAIANMISLNSENQEGSEANSINQLKKEIAEIQGPAKSILISLLAKRYLSYYYQNRWQLYERTATGGLKSDDIATWTTEDFHAKIGELYLQSLQPEKILQATLLAPFDEIIFRGNVRKLRPTLYDLLAHEALEYFASDERNIKKPSYAFEISTASAFDPAADFIHRKFETKDSASLEYFALTLYQKLVALHINDPQPDALIDVDLQRIQYVNSKSVHTDKDQLYFMAINHVAEQYQKTPAAAQAWYLVALWHNQRGDTYNPDGDTTMRFERIKAAEICEKTIKENPETEGGINAHNLLNGIKQKSFGFQTENVNIPNKPFLALFSYRNIRRLQLKLVRATGELKIKMALNRDNEFWNDLAKAAPVKVWQQVLPDTKDFQEHKVEVKVDALPIGEYMLIASSGDHFLDAKNLLAARLVTISNISFVRNEHDIFVLNRDTGQPIPKATVKIWEVAYDYTSRANRKLKSTLYPSDLNGHIKKALKQADGKSITEVIEITDGEDKLALENHIQTYYYGADEDDDDSTQNVYLFTDRSIYRPGQIVFFKGIVANNKMVVSNSTEEIELVLSNANDEEVEKKQVKSNAYGSFSGSFQLPKNALNGEFKITADDENEVTFRVEEYKRPKFEVKFDTLRITYKVNDTIRVTGNSIAYAGNAIDGAMVSYRVQRIPRFVYPWLSKRWLPTASPMEITHGETATDAAGKFIIPFEAIPDLKIDRKLDPVFDYVIYADVTDNNGETRSGETRISVGYKSLVLQVNIPEKLPADSLKTLSIRTENMNGEFEPAQVKVVISGIIPEPRLIRKKLWNRPDQFVMSKADFVRDFPNDEYDDETEQENWPVKQVALEKTSILQKEKEFELTGTTFAPGFYKIEISTTDKAGAEIKDVKYIELTNPASNKNNRPQYLWTATAQPIEPGEKTSIQIGSSADHLFVISNSGQEASKNSPYTFLQLNDQKRAFPFTATEADRGGYPVSYVFVKHNRVYLHQDWISVPWINKELKIEYLSFRDKTLPGSKEQWKVKISGYKKEKVAAEMLGSMYDASLDEFVVHQWSKPNLFYQFHNQQNWAYDGNFTFTVENAIIRYLSDNSYKYIEKSYDQLLIANYFEVKSAVMGNKASAGGGGERSRILLSGRVAGLSVAKKDQAEVEEPAPAQMMIGGDEKALSEVVVVGYGVQKKGKQSIEKNPNEADIIPRKNFNETAFFLPELHTNQDGEIEFSFTLPEALTRWKFQALAHTKELAFGYSSKEIITQKELMVQPNAPRFLREADKISFPAKVVNLSDKTLNGEVSLLLFDTETNQPVDDIFKNPGDKKAFSIPAGQSASVLFSLEVPKGFTKTLTWRVIAKAGNLSDGEENVLPVLSNRMLVTESMPLNIRGSGNKDFKFDKLINSGASKTLAHQMLTVEYTSNPAWYAVQALPYLMEYPYECAEQTWNRYYANALATHIVGTSSRIAKVFETWKKADTTALLSNLEKNQELKSVLLEETPWVLAAKSESEQKRNIALLFDLVKMGGELDTNLEKLLQMQSPNGGFVWFKGGPDDRYITQYIVSAIGHLKKIGAIPEGQLEKIDGLLKTAIPYLDKRIKEDYEQLAKVKADLKNHVPGAIEIQYLYTRSFFPENAVPTASQKAYQYFRERAKLTWVNQSKYLQGLTALSLHRTKDSVTPKAILKSLKETAVYNEEMGMYWKSNQRGWWWYEAPIERQALLIEAFQEISNDTKTVDNLKTWLLKNKQTNRWESTKATAEACYALLSQGSSWLNDEKTAVIHLGETIVKSDTERSESGTGYFKKSIEGNQVTASMGNIQVEVKSANATSAQPNWGLPGWGSVYWQYFEDLDKITFAETPLKLSKKLFIEKNSDKGPMLSPISESDMLHVGDKIKVRIELRADRDMEYVHMKDMRASAFEPVNVLSSYKWQGGLGYYETTKDASTNFFFNLIRKGIYVFEYPLFVTHEGNFSNGITTIQCMYAPEFTAHSEGVRVGVEKGK